MIASLPNSGNWIRGIFGHIHVERELAGPLFASLPNSEDWIKGISGHIHVEWELSSLLFVPGF